MSFLGSFLVQRNQFRFMVWKMIRSLISFCQTKLLFDMFHVLHIYYIHTVY